MQIIKFIIAICFAFFVKLFVFQPFVIPSSSMDRTLVQGDYVLVNKWQNSLFGNLLNIQKGDVLAFYYPLEKGDINDKMVFIKRCVAQPGDTLLIKNGQTENDKSDLQFDYLISDSSNKLNWDILNNLDIHLGGRASNNRWLLSLDSIQISGLLKIDSAFVFNRNSSIKGGRDLSIFPSDSLLKWNRDFYGPLYIPKKGVQIKLDSSNFKLYKKIISEYESHHIKMENSLIFIDEIQTDSYTFKQNYYFMMGDNRHHSQDSRYWGFVPENHIIGKCGLVLFNADKFSLKRLLIGVN